MLRAVPHGPQGRLCVRLVPAERQAALAADAAKLPPLRLTDRQLCDFEMIANGGFSPLTGFMGEADYRRVCREMRLVDGTLWPIPICLDVSEADAARLPVGSRVALEDEARRLLGVLTVQEAYRPDKHAEAAQVFGKDDEAHPSVAYLHRAAGAVYLAGPVDALQLPVYYDFTELRRTPTELRAVIEKLGWLRTVAFQTRNPMHRSHRELTVRAARDAKANLLVHPVVGLTKPGDVDHYTRVRCYLEVMKHYPTGMALLSLLPLAMRMGGPREAVLHAIVRKNYGCSHFIVGRDHAGPGNDSAGKPFYGDYDAHALVAAHEAELGIKVMFYQMVVYVEDRAEYMQQHEVPKGSRALNISGTELRRRLFRGIDIPSWFTYPEVVSLLRQSYPARHRQGVTVFFTGLSGSGKSTIANALRIALLEEGSRPVTLLDGDEVRTHLSTTLGFTREHRDLNIQRIGYVASLITKARGIAICAAIAPYVAAREGVRRVVSEEGGFVEVYVATPLEACEARDRKGLYAKARKGLIKGFTGISDPYEPPQSPELTIDTTAYSVTAAVARILLHLEQEGFLAARSQH